MNANIVAISGILKLTLYVAPNANDTTGRTNSYTMELNNKTVEEYLRIFREYEEKKEMKQDDTK